MDRASGGYVLPAGPPPRAWSPPPDRVPTKERSVPTSCALFRRIVVGYDGSRPSTCGLGWARATAAAGARIDVVHATRHTGRELETEIAFAQHAAQHLREAGFDARSLIVSGSPRQHLSEAAADLDAELVIIGATGRSELRRKLLGSVAGHLLRSMRHDLLIARSPPPPRQVLVATDGSDHSASATRVGAAIARGFEVPATLLHVVPLPVARATLPLGAFPAELARDVPAEERRRFDCILLGGEPREIILRHSVEKPGLLVIGRTGVGQRRDGFAGTVSTHLAHHAPTNVLLVRSAEA